MVTIQLKLTYYRKMKEAQIDTFPLRHPTNNIFIKYADFRSRRNNLTLQNIY